MVLGHTNSSMICSETLLRELPAEAEVHVVANPEVCEVETRVVFHGGSATRTISFLDLGELPQERIVEIVRELIPMLPNLGPSPETNR